jgi:CDP-diacylglycerol---glycerol-3-phosphate 3-phosphatidyltransferase
VDCRPVTAAAAALVIAGTIALSLRGLARIETAEPAPDPDGPLIGPRIRTWYRGLFTPLEEQLAALEVHPDDLTYAALVVSVLAGVAFARGAFFLAGWLTILAGTLDIVDGGLARLTGLASPRGAFVDSVVDRLAEFATFLGLGIWFVHERSLLGVAIAAFASQMVSYVRARAEGLGVELASGLAQRPERYLILGTGAWLTSLLGHLLCPLLGYRSQKLLVLTVWVLAAVATWTAVERTRDAVAALRTREHR